jgi:hypothetical protein
VSSQLQGIRLFGMQVLATALGMGRVELAARACNHAADGSRTDLFSRARFTGNHSPLTARQHSKHRDSRLQPQLQYAGNITSHISVRASFCAGIIEHVTRWLIGRHGDRSANYIPSSSHLPLAPVALPPNGATGSALEAGACASSEAAPRRSGHPAPFLQASACPAYGCSLA